MALQSGLPFLGSDLGGKPLGTPALQFSVACLEVVDEEGRTVPLGQAEAARSIGLAFGHTLRHVVLPQAFRGAIAPLGNTLIALTKNTTVVATVGVAEAAYRMRNMIEFNPSQLYWVFAIIATGFVILTLPIGVLFTWLSNRLSVQR